MTGNYYMRHDTEKGQASLLLSAKMLVLSCMQC